MEPNTSSSSSINGTSVSSASSTCSSRQENKLRQETKTSLGWNICTTGGWGNLNSPTAWSLDEIPLGAPRPNFKYGYGNGSYYYSNDKGATWIFNDGKGGAAKKVVSNMCSTDNVGSS